MKRLLAMLMTLAMILCLVACGSQPAAAPATAPEQTKTEGTSEAPAAEDPMKIGFICSDPSSGFWKEVLESFSKAASENGIDFTYQAVNDSAAMRSAYDSMISQQVDIVVNGYASEEIAVAYAEEAVDSGMPMLCVAFNCPVEGVYSYGTSNTGLGEFFGNYALDALNKEWSGKLDLIITCNAYTSVPAMASRTDGAVEVLQANGYADVEWVAIDTGLDTSTIGANMSAALTSHPDAENILIVVCTDAFCPTIVNALEDAGASDKVIMLSCDCTETYINYAKEHNGSSEWTPWYGSIDLNTATYGYKLLDKVFAIMNGTVDEVYTEHSGVMVTSANILDYYG